MKLKTPILPVLALALAGLLMPFRAGAAPVVIPVWPHLNVPAGQRHPPRNKQGVLLAPIRWPIMTFYPAPRTHNTGTAIIICPGGAYVSEWVPGEGLAPAKWFNKLGVNAFILRYRLPDGKLPPGGVPWPLQDVRRAMQIIRAHAGQWHINRHRIGVIGFSAGGSVAALAGVHWLPGNPDARNPLNGFSTRPDFLVLCYPVISMIPGITHPLSHDSLLGKNAPMDVDQYFSGELNVTALTPPAFICFAHDDPLVPTANSIRFYKALRKNGIPAELRMFQRGGHGFGLGRPGTGTVKWPKECEHWLRKLHFLPAKKH
jgi:acetyl esterase/lipase